MHHYTHRAKQETKDFQLVKRCIQKLAKLCIQKLSMIKRGREEVDTANCLMLLSRVGQSDLFTKPIFTGGRTFTCKTCNRKFPSFQALGGHRASHKKPKLAGDDLSFKLPSSPPKPKTHECSICGLEFPIGQALGGHMRRHRVMLIENGSNNNKLSSSTATSNSTSSGSTVSAGYELPTREIEPVPEVVKAHSCRIFGVELSSAPSDQMDLKLELGKRVMACPPVLDLFA